MRPHLSLWGSPAWVCLLLLLHRLCEAQNEGRSLHSARRGSPVQRRKHPRCRLLAPAARPPAVLPHKPARPYRCTAAVPLPTQ